MAMHPRGAHALFASLALCLFAACATSTGNGGGDSNTDASTDGGGQADIGGLVDTGDAGDSGGTDAGDDAGDATTDTPVAGVCGDGVVDDGEQCDAGAANGTDGEACTDACIIDADRDGADSATDCNDADAAQTPGADELCDGVDNDCDGDVDENPVDVAICALPSIDTFELSAERVAAGTNVTVSWEVSAADTVTIEADVAGIAPGEVDASGVDIVTITEDTTFTLVAVSTLGQAQLSRTVIVVPAVQITTPEVGVDDLPAATIDVAWTYTFEATGGEAPLSWASFDDLPAALALDAETGELSGTLDAVGSLTFDIAVSDALAEPQEDVRTVTLEVLPPGPTITTTSLVDGAVDQSYAATLTASGGIAPLTWTADGLPEGISLAGDALTGVPTAAGEATVTLTVTDAVLRSDSATLTLFVAPPQPSLVDGALLWGVVGSPYSATIGATSGTPPYAFSVTAGALPDGVVLSADGTLAGTPTEAGTFAITVTVTDDAGATGVGERTIVVDDVLTIGAIAWPLAEVGALYDGAIEVTGGLPPYAWELVDAAPGGLAASPDVLRLTGTPTAEGDFVLAVRVTDARSIPQQVETSLSLRVAGPAPRITTASISAGSVGAPYAAAVDVVGGTAPLAWSSADLPAGLAIDPVTGEIGGTPAAPFSGTVTVTVTDAEGRSDDATFSLVISAEAIRIVTTSVPGASAGTPYSFAMQAAGGVPPYSWRIVLGGLPVGVDMSTDGVISGTSAALGTSSFTARVSDSVGAGVNGAFELVIAPGLELLTTDLPDGAVGRAYNATLEVGGASGGVTWTRESGLFPDGVVLLPDGTIFGTPTVPGDFTVTVRATDGAGRLVEGTFSFTIVELPTEMFVTHGAFTDISAVGTPLPIGDEDDAVSPATPIGFPFTFYGTEFTDLYVSTNGTISFGTPTNSRFGEALPSPTAPGNLVAVFWDDLDPGDAGDVYVYTLGQSPTRRTIVQWSNVDYFSGDNTRINAQVMLYEGSNQVQLLYGNSEQGTAAWDFGVIGQDAVAGIQNSDGSQGVMLSDLAERNLLAGTVALFTPGATNYTMETWQSPAGRWTELGSTGAPSSASGDDAAETVPLGFTFSYFGVDFTTVTLSTNGYLTFGSSGTDFSNDPIPTATGDNGVIAPFWDDLTTGAGRILYETVGVAPFREFVVQWDGVQRLGDTTGTLRFEAVLHETTNAISFHYADVQGDTASTGASATIGVESPDGLAGTQVSFDAATLEPGDVVWIVPARGNVTTSYVASGPGDGFVDISATGLSLGIEGSDDASAVASIGFPFTYYGETYSTLNVGTNGMASFTATGSPTAGVVPSANGFNGVLAPWWNDLYPLTGVAPFGVFAETLGAAPDRRMVVQWQSLPHYSDRTQAVTFELVLYEATGAIEYHYGAMRNGAGTFGSGESAAIGLEDADGVRGVDVVLNAANAITSGSWLRFQTR